MSGVDENGANKVVLLPTIDTHDVFRHYNPYLLTYPMKAVFYCLDTATLESFISVFCADKLYCDLLVLENFVFIEYIPLQHAKVLSQIVECKENFELAAWKSMNVTQ